MTACPYKRSVAECSNVAGRDGKCACGLKTTWAAAEKAAMFAKRETEAA